MAALCAHILDRLLPTVDNKCRKYRCNCMYAVSKVWVSVCQFSHNSRLFNTLTWRFFVLNFTKVNKEMWEVLTKLFNPLSKIWMIHKIHAWSTTNILIHVSTFLQWRLLCVAHELRILCHVSHSIKDVGALCFKTANFIPMHQNNPSNRK